MEEFTFDAGVKIIIRLLYWIVTLANLRLPT
jgi:hypothetical protein